MFCPRCHGPLDPTDYYGPCGPCRGDLRRDFGRERKPVRRTFVWKVGDHFETYDTEEVIVPLDAPPWSEIRRIPIS